MQPKINGTFAGFTPLPVGWNSRTWVTTSVSGDLILEGRRDSLASVSDTRISFKLAHRPVRRRTEKLNAQIPRSEIFHRDITGGFDVGFVELFGSAVVELLGSVPGTVLRCGSVAPG